VTWRECLGADGALEPGDLVITGGLTSAAPGAGAPDSCVLRPRPLAGEAAPTGFLRRIE